MVEGELRRESAKWGAGVSTEETRAKLKQAIDAAKASGKLSDSDSKGVKCCKRCGSDTRNDSYCSRCWAFNTRHRAQRATKDRGECDE